MISLSILVLVLPLLISVTQVNGSSKLNIPKVLLPLARSTRINFTLETTEGCYRWWVGNVCFVKLQGMHALWRSVILHGACQATCLQPYCVHWSQFMAMCWGHKTAKLHLRMKYFEDHTMKILKKAPFICALPVRKSWHFRVIWIILVSEIRDLFSYFNTQHHILRFVVNFNGKSLSTQAESTAMCTRYSLFLSRNRFLC